MRAYFAPRARLEEGWRDGVRLVVGSDGRIAEIHAGRAPEIGDHRLPGPVVPAGVDVHGHSFQRAMAGRAERSAGGRDDFWTWREQMYRVAGGVDPEALTAISALCFAELAEGGFGHAVEFHYLHREVAAAPGADPAVMAAAIIEGAHRAGIGLTLLPCLYMRGGFDGRPLEGPQRRFEMGPRDAVDLVDALRRTYAELPTLRLGLAVHSLRAVPLEAAAEAARSVGEWAPVHVHVSEQEREVSECVAALGSTPVRALLDGVDVDGRWTLVHATHATPTELDEMAARGCVVGLCPTTEANLGDGLFDVLGWLQRRGAFGVGTDSHVSSSMAAELQLLAYGQRLKTKRRVVCAPPSGGHAASELFGVALRGGARAAGLKAWGLAAGAPATWLVLDDLHPSLFGLGGEALLDAWIFGPGRSPIREAWTEARPVVLDGVHVARRELEEAYRDAMTALHGA